MKRGDETTLKVAHEESGQDGSDTEVRDRPAPSEMSWDRCQRLIDGTGPREDEPETWFWGVA